MKTVNDTNALDRLIRIMAILRSEGGCPWDAAQTPESLRPFLLEETYEVLEAIDKGAPHAICDELGDLLLQVVFQARIFEERNQFDIQDVATAIADKLERRHPHVFGDLNLDSHKALAAEWDRIKRQEKTDRGEYQGTLGGVPKALPALQRAHKLTEKASRAGFSWPDTGAALAKVNEELRELEHAIDQEDRQGLEDELGDLLFAVTNLARLLDIDSEATLRKALDRFLFRFNHVEQTLSATGRSISQSDHEELEQLWQKAKSAASRAGKR